MIDLHMHSMFSDGTFTPEELVSAGVRMGVTAMALTDHDTTAGVPRFLAATAAAGMKAFTGVEVSADAGAGTMHVLGYGVLRLANLLDELSEDSALEKMLPRIGFTIRTLAACNDLVFVKQYTRMLVTPGNFGIGYGCR